MACPVGEVDVLHPVRCAGDVGGYPCHTGADAKVKPMSQGRFDVGLRCRAEGATRTAQVALSAGVAGEPVTPVLRENCIVRRPPVNSELLQSRCDDVVVLTMLDRRLTWSVRPWRVGEVAGMAGDPNVRVVLVVVRRQVLIADRPVDGALETVLGALPEVDRLQPVPERRVVVGAPAYRVVEIGNERPVRCHREVVGHGPRVRSEGPVTAHREFPVIGEGGVVHRAHRGPLLEAHDLGAAPGQHVADGGASHSRADDDGVGGLSSTHVKPPLSGYNDRELLTEAPSAR